MSAEPPSPPPEPQPPDEDQDRPPGGFGFGLQAFTGLALVALIPFALFRIKAVQMSAGFIPATLGLLVVIAIVCCFTPRWRGIGCGVLLGLGLGVLIILSICARGFSNL
jgi:hypothetical protein